MVVSTLTSDQSLSGKQGPYPLQHRVNDSDAFVSPRHTLVPDLEHVGRDPFHDRHERDKDTDSDQRNWSHDETQANRHKGNRKRQRPDQVRFLGHFVQLLQDVE